MSNTKPSVPVLQVGDVIASPAFANGWFFRNTYNGRVDDQLWVTDAAKIGYQDCPQPDQTRGDARYVIEESLSPLANGLDSIHICRHSFPNDWWDDIKGAQITARRLHDDGSYDPDGELINFVWHTGKREFKEIEEDRKSGRICFTRTILPSSLTVVGRKRRHFI